MYTTDSARPSGAGTLPFSPAVESPDPASPADAHRAKTPFSPMSRSGGFLRVCRQRTAAIQARHDTRSTDMTRIHYAAFAAAMVLGSTITASAQSRTGVRTESRVQVVEIDAMDGLGQLSARRLTQMGIPNVVFVTAEPTMPPDPNETYRQQYEEYLQIYAEAAAENSRGNGGSRWTNAVQGIATGMQLSHEALDLYDHALDVNYKAKALSGN
jgi:hypothetical protein